MKFSSILSISVAAFAVCSFLPAASGAAIDNSIVKRDAASDAKGILDEATSSIAPIKAQLLEAYKGGDLTDEAFVRDTVLPLVAQMNGIVGEAAVKVTALSATGGVLGKRQVDTDAVAQALQALVAEVVEALEPLINFLSCISIVATLLGTLLANLDTNLNTIATGLGILLAGVLELVRDLLTSLTNALSGLGFLNFLALLGLIPQ